MGKVFVSSCDPNKYNNCVFFEGLVDKGTLQKPEVEEPKPNPETNPKPEEKPKPETTPESPKPSSNPSPKPSPRPGSSTPVPPANSAKITEASMMMAMPILVALVYG
jgi:outer membrane biosynthesis protein TonB